MVRKMLSFYLIVFLVFQTGCYFDSYVRQWNDYMSNGEAQNQGIETAEVVLFSQPTDELTGEVVEEKKKLEWWPWILVGLAIAGTVLALTLPNIDDDGGKAPPHVPPQEPPPGQPPIEQ